MLSSKRSNPWVRGAALACFVALLLAMAVPAGLTAHADPAIDFAALARAIGTPDIPGLKVV